MTKKLKIWTCKIGEVEDGKLPGGSDWPMRQAARRAYFELTGQEADFVFSGWGGELTPSERAVVMEDCSDVYLAGTGLLPKGD